MNITNIPYFEDEKNKLMPDVPMIERNVVHVIIFNPKTDEVLCLEWSKFDWKTFIVGGIENDEDLIVASEREVKEETGYKHIKYIAEVGKTKSAFYAAHKKENRIANATGMLFELIDTDRDEISESESKNHTFKWVPKDEVSNFINLDNQKYIWGIAIKEIEGRRK